MPVRSKLVLLTLRYKFKTCIKSLINPVENLFQNYCHFAIP